MRNASKYNYIFIIGVALLLFLFLCTRNISAITDRSVITPERNVLVIHQYSVEDPYQDLFNQGLREIFAQDDRYYYNISYEYLEIDKLPHDVVYLDMKIDHLIYKMKRSNWVPDVVVASSGVSDWLIKYKNELFEDIPVVACAPAYAGKSTIPVNHFTDHYLLQVNDDFANNYQLILDLLPGTNNIYVVLGNSYEEKNLLSLAQEDTKDFEDKVTFIFTNKKSNAEMISTLRNAPDDSAVLFSRWITDIEGEFFGQNHYLQFLSSSINIPVFGTQQQFLGSGIVGGHLRYVSLYGEDAGSMAIELSDGIEPTAHTDGEHYLRYVFDDRALKKWNISSDRLPAGSEILYAEENFWQEHGDIIFIVAVIILLETGLIIGLIRNNRRRVKAEAELLLLNESLEEIVKKRTLELQEINTQLEKLNEILDYTSRIDPLTGLYNRRHINERLNEELQIYRRRGQEFSVMLIDIDDFKLANDKHGHKAGDHILKNLANIFRESVREYDVVSRWGGEEFLLLFPSLGEADALIRAEKLRIKVQDFVCNYEGINIPITVTIGIATIRENETISQLINRADVALYQGKFSGKNKCVLSD